MLSLITSLYRSDEHLEKFLKNLEKFMLEVDFDYEIIIISNDPTPKELALRENLKKYSSVSFHSVAQESLYATWNRGVGLSQGDIVGFWNVDDTRFASALKNGIELIRKENDLVFFPFIYKRYLRLFGLKFLVKIKKIDPPKFNAEEFSQSMHCGPFFIFTKDFYKKIGPFDEKFRIAGDFDWCIRAAKEGGRLIKCSVIAGVFENSGKSLSGSRNLTLATENFVIYKRYCIKKDPGNIDHDLLENYRA